jgi:hypothetical protein
MGKSRAKSDKDLKTLSLFRLLAACESDVFFVHEADFEEEK